MKPTLEIAANTGSTNLPVGIYKVSASSANFATSTINGIAVELNKTSTLPDNADEIQAAITSVGDFWRAARRWTPRRPNCNRLLKPKTWEELRHWHDQQGMGVRSAETFHY